MIQNNHNIIRHIHNRLGRFVRYHIFQMGIQNKHVRHATILVKLVKNIQNVLPVKMIEKEIIVNAHLENMITDKTTQSVMNVTNNVVIVLDHQITVPNVVETE
jgi:hypothetical protein